MSKTFELVYMYRSEPTGLAAGPPTQQLPEVTCHSPAWAVTELFT